MNRSVNPDLKFMVCGFSKCGTTTLCDLLSSHPAIYIPRIKETNFFALPDFEGKWDEFRAHFAPMQPRQIGGEGTTRYSAYEHEKISRDRILHYFPDMKFIFIARHPKKRIESSYREFHHSGINFALNCPYGLKKAMQELPALVQDTKYWQRIQNYRDVVGDNRILVLFLDDLEKDYKSTLIKCFRFLSVDPQHAEKISMVKKNSKEEKLYDSKLLRWMRLKPFWGFKIAKLTPDQQNKYLYWIGLRRKFKKPLTWDADALEIVAQEITGDSEQFLTFYGKPKNFWDDMPQPTERKI